MNWGKVFRYDNGNLIRISTNKISGSIRKDGYKTVFCIDQMYYVHRIVWELFNGTIPSNMEIDHINRNKADNNIKNLRLVTKRGNALNRKHKAIGVYKDRGYWKVGFTVNNKWKHFGMFSDYNEAIATAKQIYEKLLVKYI